MKEYPIGIQNFEALRRGDFYYVDKTDYVYDLTRTRRSYFLCRPRRFGKSLLLSTFKSYFEGKKDLFEGLKIASLEKEWKPRPVIAHCRHFLERERNTQELGGGRALIPYGASAVAGGAGTSTSLGYKSPINIRHFA